MNHTLNLPATTPLSRRQFIIHSSLLIGSLALEQNAFATPKHTTMDISAQRAIGALKVNPIGIGCMNAAWGFGNSMSKKDATTLFRNAANIGQNFFDTAEVYGAWLSEEMVGEALSPMRHDVIIASKFGFSINEKGGITGLDSHPKSIKKAVEGSLKRLKTDYIDLLYQHRVDPKIPIEDVAGTVQDLINEGKVREFGLSEVGAATIKRAHSIQKVSAVQNEYSLWVRDPEGEVLDVCESLAIALIPWSPLGKGFLSGTIQPHFTFSHNDRRSTMPRFTHEAMRANWPLIELLQKIAMRHNATPAQISLAWLLARKPFIIPIPGTTNIQHLQENMQASFIKLSKDDMHDLEAGYANIKLVGKRAAEDVLAFSDIGSLENTRSEGTHGNSPLPTHHNNKGEMR